MDIVIDTSALVAVIADEPERGRIIELTSGNNLIGPGSIPWEIGNAFTSMFKHGQTSLEEAKKGLAIFLNIPLRFIETDFFNALSIANEHNMYAYDAYFLDCAMKLSAPILTLDRKLMDTAQKLKIKVLEV